MGAPRQPPPRRPRRPPTPPARSSKPASIPPRSTLTRAPTYHTVAKVISGEELCNGRRRVGRAHRSACGLAGGGADHRAGGLLRYRERHRLLPGVEEGLLPRRGPHRGAHSDGERPPDEIGRAHV